eukprot:gnl/MRDRNA2_/MRDRNA2_95154_c0_seq1.p1 gnl/MRDRNA2_/MRDRNA2_95154_c0~~gnl/MRDRNA2_/MRDRNA2_95154_c0_seq1.p1  ORF type:complete len:289 (-),score=57.88 gnl/MRDRNA2_/MRDRNA2_95154_c0_seq1:113-979(-)
MCSISVIFGLALFVQAQSEQPKVNQRDGAQDMTDELITSVMDKMSGRALHVLPFQRTDLDETTFGKPGNLAISSPSGPTYTRPAVSHGAIAPFQLRNPGKPMVSGSSIESFQPASLQPRSHTVVAAKRERMKGGGQGQRRPEIPIPPVDPDNEEFVIFVRSKKLQMWVPCTMIKGTNAANQLVKSLGDTGKSLQKDTLIRSLGESIYGNQKELLKAAKKSSPMLGYAKEFEFGFKVRDKSNPKDWYIPKQIVTIPPEGELPEAPLAGATKAFDSVKESITNMFKPKTE